MFKNHPRGMITIFFTEMWERFGFYILMAVLVLYMDKEFHWPDAKKGDYYGLFLGAVYFLPILGGWLGDKVFGMVRSIKVGAIIMAAGFVMLGLSSVDRIFLFPLGLAFIAFGTGIFKVNISVMVGNLYEDKPELKDAGYNIYYMGVNLGAAIAPLAATAISAYFHSYRISFWVAAIGLIGAYIIFTLGQNQYKHLDNFHRRNDADMKEKKSQMDPVEKKDRILTLIILFVIVIFFWLAFYQNGFAMTLFAERSTIHSKILRPETYQFFNPFFILVLTPLLVGFFQRLNQKGKEPSTPMKIFIGIIIMSGAMLVMVLASYLGGNMDKNIMSPLWLIGSYFLVTLAEINISPMGQSYVSKVAPSDWQGVMMGLWFGAIAMGSYGSGLLGKFYSDMPHHMYFLLLTGILLFSAILVLLAMKKLKRYAG